MKSSIAKHLSLTASLLLLASACSAADPATTAEGSEEPEIVTEFAVVLDTVKPSDQQTIQILAYGDELIGVSEWRGAKFASEPRDSLLDFDGRSIAEFYGRVAGKAADRSVVERLRTAEALAVNANLAAEPAIETARADAVTKAAADLHAPGIAETAEPGGTPAVRTLALECAQDPVYYDRYSSGWAGTHCSNPPGWEDVWCRTNEMFIKKDWTHAEKWWVKFHNMSRCNTAVGFVHAKRTGKYVGLGGVTLGANNGWSQWWYVTNREWRFLTQLEHGSGGEPPHLNMATYRMW